MRKRRERLTRLHRKLGEDGMGYRMPELDGR